MFEHCGLIEGRHPDADTDIEIAALEAEADNVEAIDPDDGDDEPSEGTGARFFCASSSLDSVTKALKAAGWNIALSELHYQPKDFPELTDAQREEATDFLRTLDDHPDVHRIYAALR